MGFYIPETVLIFQIFNISNFAKTIIKCSIIEMKYLAYNK